MQVFIPTPLRSYTSGRSQVEGSGETLDALIEHLDARYPGIRFRMIDEQGQMRPHIRFFVGGDLAPRISQCIGPQDEVQIICALSGG